jgi:Tol biopolymer transport system component
VPRRHVDHDAAWAARRVLVAAALALACPQLLDDRFRDDPPGNPGRVEPNAGRGAGGEDAGNQSEGGSAGVGNGGAESAEAGRPATAGTGGASSGTDSGATPGCSAYGEFTTPERLTGLARSGALWGPSLSRDGVTLAFAEEVGGLEDIYFANRAQGSVFGAAATAQTINTSANEGTPFLGLDGSSLYFYSNRAGGAGGRDLYVATRTSASDSFGNAALVPGVNSANSEHLPWVSSDALEILFSSTRAGGSGSYDIYRATRANRAAPFTGVTNLGALNSPSPDESPSVSGDQLSLVFTSSRSGNYDIWLATRPSPTSAFGAPSPVDALNGTSDDMNITLSSDGLEVIFSSDRQGTVFLYRATRECE